MYENVSVDKIVKKEVPFEVDRVRPSQTDSSLITARSIFIHAADNHS